MSITGAFQRDENFVPITTFGITTTKAITYATATTGAIGVTTLFTVTGVVAMRVFAVCGTDLTGAGATIEIGIVGNTAAVIAQSVGTTIDTGEIWYGTNPPTVGVLPSVLVLSATNVIQTIATATVDAGQLTYYCLWAPISSNGSVVAA